MNTQENLSYELSEEEIAIICDKIEEDFCSMTKGRLDNYINQLLKERSERFEKIGYEKGKEETERIFYRKNAIEGLMESGEL